MILRVDDVDLCTHQVHREKIAVHYTPHIVTEDDGALHPHLTSGGRRETGVIALRASAHDLYIRFTGSCLRDFVLQLSCLVSAHGEIGQIVALDVHADPQLLAEVRQEL